MKTLLTSIMLFGPIVYLMASAMMRSFCNNYNQRKRVITIVKSENDERVIGECGWFSLPEISKPSERMRRLREIEPRGA